MPGKPFGGSMDGPPSTSPASLKGHKPLPRRKVPAVGSNPRRSTSQEQGARRESERIAFTSADRIKSWIPDASPIKILPATGVPLTPPINFRDDFQSWIEKAALRDQDHAVTYTSGSPGSTPFVQQSPPTPEITPPEKTDSKHGIRSSSSSRNPQESSTDSFQTAQEDQYSSDDVARSESPSLKPSRQKWLNSTGVSQHRHVGLGLGLESEDEESTAKEMTPKDSPKTQDFTFDGGWDANPKHLVPSHENSTISTSIPLGHRERSGQRPRIASEPPQDSPTLGLETEKPRRRSSVLQEEVDKPKSSLPNALRDKSREQAEWPLKDETFELDTGSWDSNDKRLSQVSTTSTIVEAMVINPPPRRRQTLRHTGKMADLNSTNPLLYDSKRNSPTANDPSFRRRLRRSKSPDQELRKTFASDTLEIVTPSVTQSVIHIPGHRSSLQSSSASSKQLSRTFSLTSRQQSSRPTTAPEEAVGYFDIPRRRDRRTMSVVIHSATPVKTEARISRRSTPPAPIETSLPSPLPAKEPPMGNSVISPDFVPHVDPNATTNQPPPAFKTNNAHDVHHLNVDHIAPSEWSAMRPRSSLVTPLSLRSAQSSTPGTLEVNEATAISIYPHTNKSILVIQQTMNGSDNSPRREQAAIIAGNANIALSGPVTPVVYQESPPRDELISPLKYPREPPQPPDFKIIPPTPANAGTSDDMRSAPRPPITSNRLSAPVSSLKRAFSARRPHSDLFVKPITRTFSLRGTAGSPRRRSQIVNDPESKLHPFWKPRAFWDDAQDSDSDSEFGNTGDLTGARMPSQSPKDFSPRRTMSLTRRITESLRFPNHTQSQRRASLMVPTDQERYRFIDSNFGDDAAHEADFPSRSGFYRRSTGFLGLVERLERHRAAKEEGKREQRRRSLRAKIGPVENVVHGDGGSVGGIRW